MDLTTKQGFKIEQQLIYLSIIGDLVCALLDVVVGIRNDSTAITFDGLYCLICFFGDILLIIYCKKIDAPANNVFQFGYGKIEPVLIVTQTLVIVGSCIFALISTLRDIFHLHVISSFLEIVILQSSIAFVSLLIGMVCYYYGKKHANKILLVQSMIWLLDCVESLFMAAGFSLGCFIKNTKYAWISPYIDPTIMICLTVTIIREPIKVLYSNFMELLDASINEITSEEIDDNIRPIVRKNLPNLNIRTILKRKCGRKLFVIVLFDSDSDVSISQIAELRDVIREKLTIVHGNVDVKIAV